MNKDEDGFRGRRGETEGKWRKGSESFRGFFLSSISKRQRWRLTAGDERRGNGSRQTDRQTEQFILEGSIAVNG